MMKNLVSLVMKVSFPMFVMTLSVLPARGQSASEKVYKAKCAMCHANDGSGNTETGKELHARDLRSPEVQKQTDAQLIEMIAKGKKDMPGYEQELKQSQIKELVAYIRQMAKEKKPTANK